LLVAAIVDDNIRYYTPQSIETWIKGFLSGRDVSLCGEDDVHIQLLPST